MTTRSKKMKLRFAVSCSSNMNRSMEAHSFLQYTNNGLLNMLDRNRRIKSGPQRFQNETKEFDVIICLEERVYDQVLEFLRDRPQVSLNPVHVLNIDIEDNPEEATTGAVHVVSICKSLEECADLDDGIDEAIEEFENSNQKSNILHTICFY